MCRNTVRGAVRSWMVGDAVYTRHGPKPAVPDEFIDHWIEQQCTSGLAPYKSEIVAMVKKESIARGKPLKSAKKW